MPRLRKEIEDKIIELIEQGYKNVEISEKTGIHRKTIAKRRKEYLKRTQEEEQKETEPEKTIQQEQPLDPQKYMRAPTNNRALLSKITELEKRMNELEENQRGSNPSLDSLLLKRMKKIEEKQQESNPSLLEKRIKKLEKTQRGSNPSLLNRKISELEEAQRVGRSMRNSIKSDLGKLREELIESAERRHWGHYACKHINTQGYCTEWYDDEDEIPEYIRPVAWGEHKGKKVWYINVKKNPIVCSACPDYEPKG